MPKAIWLSTIALVALAGCSRPPTDRPVTELPPELPEIRHDDLGVGMQDDLDRAERLGDPEQPDLPEVPGAEVPGRDFGTFAQHMNSRVITDFDAVIPPTRVPENTDTAARTETTPTEIDALVGGPNGDVFATPEQPVTANPAPVMPETFEELVRRVAQMAAARAEETGLPLAPALRVASLESLAEGALERNAEVLGGDDAFTSEERALIDAWAALHRAANVELADPLDMAVALREAADASSAILPMRVSTIDLCTTVQGFGTYDPVHRVDDSVLLIAGSARKVIVYAEIERFMSSPSAQRGVDGFAVDLKQTVELIHLDRGTGDADLIAWAHPEERIVDFSRKRRRDFYTLQIVELPATLSIGKYHLRLTVRDSASGEQAQAIVPIDVVAGPGALGAE